MAETNPTQFAADLENVAADLITVYYNTAKLLGEYDDTGLAAEITALATDKDEAPGMAGLTKADVTNMVNTLGAFIALIDGGHRTTCNKVIATV